MGIDTKAKIVEFGRLIRKHVRKFERLEDIRIWKGLFKIQALRKHLSNFSSECFLARMAKTYGFDVKLGKYPDLLISGKRVEVKRLDSVKKYASLSNPINEGRRQKADIIAIEVFSSLERRKITDFNVKWLECGTLKKTLETAIKLVKNCNCVLLFTRKFEGRIALLQLKKKTKQN